jgi:hypothetical protein
VSPDAAAAVAADKEAGQEDAEPAAADVGNTAPPVGDTAPPVGDTAPPAGSPAADGAEESLAPSPADAAEANDAGVTSIRSDD